MRIVHTEWSDGWGGQERRIVAEMAGMAERGHEIILFTRPQCRIAKEVEGMNIRVEFLPMKRAIDFSSILPLARYIRENGVQVVNTHSGKDSWIGGLAAWKAGTAVLVRTRHLDLPLKRAWHNFIHYLPDAVISCGASVRETLVERCGFPADEVVSIPTGVDFSRFQPARPKEEVRRALGIPREAFVVLMVGIIRGVKRHEVGLRAFAQLAAERDDALLVLAGDGPMRSNMEKLARTLGLEDRILFLGHREDIPDVMAMGDALMLTSRSEGVPQAVTQALGLGLPVAATRVGGVPELIIHEETGVLVEAEDVNGMGAALARFASDAESAAALGARGRAHVLAHFSLPVMLDKTEALYDRLWAAREGGGGEA